MMRRLCCAFTRSQQESPVVSQNNLPSSSISCYVIDMVSYHMPIGGHLNSNKRTATIFLRFKALGGVAAAVTDTVEQSWSEIVTLQVETRHCEHLMEDVELFSSPG
ncbi:hypothetical protein PFLUV_G00030670 [Perca fluviatilis]|uniref:Uncharacterized protein n=1 Tax=Perca fluviatilis TaxID=8168 RepID=A0A6A5FEM8_PERFL|nr:hypothetical protein PFLUV_G00030670 [Perca fluviatilis]